MYDNIRHKLTLAFIIIMTLISCFAGETLPMWVGSDWIWFGRVLILNVGDNDDYDSVPACLRSDVPRRKELPLRALLSGGQFDGHMKR